MKVHVNGETIEVPDGSSVSIINGQVTINGGDWIDHGGKGLPEIGKLVVEGNAGRITTDKASVEVHGNVSGPVEAGSSVSCGDVGGYVSAGSSVSCGDVAGSVKAGSSISCGDVYNGKLR